MNQLEMVAKFLMQSEDQCKEWYDTSEHSDHEALSAAMVTVSNYIDTDPWYFTELIADTQARLLIESIKSKL